MRILYKKIDQRNFLYVGFKESVLFKCFLNTFLWIKVVLIQIMIFISFMQFISFTLDMIMVTSLKFMIILLKFLILKRKKKSNKLRKAITDGKPK